jgi:hypothetical protein
MKRTLEIVPIFATVSADEHLFTRTPADASSFSFSDHRHDRNDNGNGVGTMSVKARRTTSARAIGGKNRRTATLDGLFDRTVHARGIIGVSNVHHVETVTRIAVEDGVISVDGVGEDGAQAFTAFGIENLIELARICKENPTLLKRGRPK